MPENEPNGNKEAGKEINAYAKYTGIVFQMIAIIAIFAFVGYYLDAKMKNQTPVITALSCLVGVCLSIFQIIRQLK